MANGTAVAAAHPGFFREKILMGMTWREYIKANLTWTNAIIAVIFAVGFPLIVARFALGLGATTNLSQNAPWGLWIGFDMMTGIVLAAGGFTIGSAVQLFGLKEYHPIERPAILTAFLGYLMSIAGLVADLGRPWNLIQALFNYGTASVLFEVAWCVMCYSTVLFLEFSVPLFEWLGWRRIHGIMKKTMIALTVLSVMFSTMHQSALGSLFLMAPTKLHPLWYSNQIFVHFFVSAVMAGLSMVIVESTLSHKAFHSQVKDHPVDMDKLTIGLGKAAAVTFFAYFFLRLQNVIDQHAWNLIGTPMGYWFLFEIVGLVLIPSLMFAYGAHNGKAKIVRIAAALGVTFIVLNRANMSMIAYNYNVPWEERYVPNWIEVWVSVTLVTLGVVLFRWIVNRMPILREDPAFPQHH